MTRPTTAERTLAYDDLAVGDTFEAGTETLTRAEIVSFADQWDPQPFHLDDAAGEASMFGELVASGLHTYCACNALATEAFFSRVDFRGGRGVDELRWHRPVIPGDELSVTVEVVDKSTTGSGRGDVDTLVTGYRGDERVVSWTVLGLVGRADGAAD